MSVLIPDGNGATALAIVRSLGKKNIDVTVASNTRRDISFFSKYCTHKVLYPDPKDNEDKYIQEMLKIVKKGDYDVLFLVDERALIPISHHRDKFSPYINIPIADREVIEKADDKSQTLKIAMENDIPCPQTYFVEDAQDINKLKSELNFPVVIKPHRGEGAEGLTYVYSLDKLKNTYTKVQNQYGPSMIQEYIPYEEKYSVAALFNRDSKPRRVCVLKFIREYPITGGTATFTEGAERPDVLEYALKLLKALRYYGVAEVEFVVDPRDKRPKFQEVNPRFWGSLPSAIAAGVDFPYLLYRMAIEGDIEPSFEYKVGVKCRHLLFDDMYHLISVMKGTYSPHYKLKKLQTLLNFLKFYEDNAYYILSLDDPKPIIIKFINALSRFQELKRV